MQFRIKRWPHKFRQPHHPSLRQKHYEGHLHLGVDLHLVDAGEFVLDRVFRGDDFADRLVQRVQEGIEGCRLSGTGRPRHQEDAVRKVDDAVNQFLVVGEESQLGDAKQPFDRAEDRHHFE